MISHLRRVVSPAVRGTLALDHYYCYYYSTVPKPQTVLSPYRYFSTNESTSNEHSAAVSYLINSWGLPSKSALRVSKLLNVQPQEQTDLVLDFLKSYGFSQTQISFLARNHPNLLVYNAEETVLPILQFFESKGFSRSEVVKLVANCPNMLGRSLKEHIEPGFRFVREMLQSGDEEVLVVMKRAHYFMNQDVQTFLPPVINLLRSNKVEESGIRKLLLYCPGIFTMNLDKLTKIVKEAKAMGFKPEQMKFIDAIIAFASMAKSTRQGKFEAYQKWGLSEEDVWAAFRRRPFCLKASEDQITGVMDLFVNKLQWGAPLVAMNPVLVSLSLKKRLLPRAAVLEFLISKGLVEEDYKTAYFFTVPDQGFFNTYVLPFDEAREIQKLYDSKLPPS